MVTVSKNLDGTDAAKNEDPAKNLFPTFNCGFRANAASASTRRGLMRPLLARDLFTGHCRFTEFRISGLKKSGAEVSVRISDLHAG